MTEKVVQEMETLKAQDFTRKYVCSVCWGNLTREWVEGKHGVDAVYCGNPGCSGTGFVTRKYAERRRDQSNSDYIEARHNLGKALNLPNPLAEKTADELIKELGF